MPSFNAKALRESSKLWLDWFVALFQAAFIVFVLAGSVFVWAYLRSVGAPLPAADLPAMTSLFLSVTLIYGVLAALVAGFFLVPAIVNKFSPTAYDNVRPVGFTYTRWIAFAKKLMFFDATYYLALIGFSVEITESRADGQFRNSAVAIGIFLGILLTLFYSRESSKQTGSVGPAVVVMGALLDVFLTLCHVRESRGQAIIAKFHRHLEWLRSWIKIATQSVLHALFGLLWSITVFLVARRVILVWAAPSHDLKRTSVFAVLLVIAILYAALKFVSDPVKPFSATMILVVPMAVWSPSSVGAMTLRMVGVGGGIPVSILLAPLPGAKPDVEMLETRCLILNSGSQVIFRPRMQPASVSCDDSRAPFLATFPAKSSPIPGIFSSIDIVPAARVLEIVPVMSARNAATSLGRL